MASRNDSDGGRLVPIDFGRPDEPEIGKKKLAAQLGGFSLRWVELCVRDGMPSRMKGGRRAFLESDCRVWLAENRPSLKIRPEPEPERGRAGSEHPPKATPSPPAPKQDHRTERGAVEAQIALLRALRDDLTTRIAALEGGDSPAA